ncbi:hypothetical protein SAMN05216374_2326 [Tardiphaga sp. OK246]|jgi:hypothetical protein|nr:hypothetical protein SAMN05216374_2326 [Tardiphaga sp. OK246]
MSTTLISLPKTIPIPRTLKKIGFHVEALVSCQGMILVNGRPVCNARHPIDGNINPVVDNADVILGSLSSPTFPIIVTVLFVTYRGLNQSVEVKGHLLIGDTPYPFQYYTTTSVDPGITHVETCVLT